MLNEIWVKILRNLINDIITMDPIILTTLNNGGGKLLGRII